RQGVSPAPLRSWGRALRAYRPSAQHGAQHLLRDARASRLSSRFLIYPCAIASFARREADDLSSLSLRPSFVTETPLPSPSLTSSWTALTVSRMDLGTVAPTPCETRSAAISRTAE